jgi:hypothetical protein
MMSEEMAIKEAKAKAVDGGPRVMRKLLTLGRLF